MPIDRPVDDSVLIPFVDKLEKRIDDLEEVATSLLEVLLDVGVSNAENRQTLERCLNLLHSS